MSSGRSSGFFEAVVKGEVVRSAYGIITFYGYCSGKGNGLWGRGPRFDGTNYHVGFVPTVFEFEVHFNGPCLCFSAVCVVCFLSFIFFSVPM